MPNLMTVEWKHVLLDPNVYQTNGTYRVARIRGGVGAFPIPPGGSGRWESEYRTWNTMLSGRAPESYEFEGRVFNFGFWSVKEYVNGVYRRGASNTFNDYNVTYFSDQIRVEATAFYYWNFGDGPGGHGVYLDAFDETNQEFMPDDFVDVIPDDETGSLTAAANDGLLRTDSIANSVVRARNPTGATPYRRYAFINWTDEQNLGATNPATVPLIDGSDIRIRNGSVVAALAHYRALEGQPPPEVTPRGPAGYIIGIPAGGPYFYVPFGGFPQPVDPPDPSALFGPALAQLSARIEELRKRIEQLEKRG